MINRDDYVQKLKAQIDRWNSEAATWEGQAKKVQADAQAEYTRQLEQLRKHRDEAIAEMRRVQGASADAWSELARGADAALKSMQEAFDKARAGFDKKK
jgi:lipid II:glycine glycyltransferase (peptidoglycan interpeptide bridge formation enzyme)